MSYIYLIKSEVDETILYKIGFSKNPKQRLKELKIGNPNLEIVATWATKHNHKLESTLHNNYKHKNINGEWFSLSSDEAESFLEKCEQIEQNLDYLKKSNNPFIK